MPTGHQTARGAYQRADGSNGEPAGSRTGRHPVVAGSNDKDQPVPLSAVKEAGRGKQEVNCHGDQIGNGKFAIPEPSSISERPQEEEESDKEESEEEDSKEEGGGPALKKA
ncbi:hypothetical protein F5876DRAFT_74192 [Lentinula aff. lateritia]|uniref:Uncharacterized protein n=1 Tax=Lentinula aff. lateritia TaxID=2804960 RepID=A0ACC1U8H6_9AGAR|nr:hypothetical protein F5876DRAFT_74192 [Lentinula aff. lateritia]